MSVSEITSLQNTLNGALDAYKAELAAQNLPEPSLNTSKLHPIDDMTYLPTPAMYEARRVAVASLVRSNPFLCYGCIVTSFYFTRVCSNLLSSLLTMPLPQIHG